MSDHEITAPVPRRLVQPTDEQLKKEAIEACRVLTEVWDDEVEVLVVMSRRISRSSFYGSSFHNLDKLKAVLKGVADAVSTFGVRLHKGKLG